MGSNLARVPCRFSWTIPGSKRSAGSGIQPRLPKQPRPTPGRRLKAELGAQCSIKMEFIGIAIASFIRRGHRPSEYHAKISQLSAKLMKQETAWFRIANARRLGRVWM
jgi:hypothetical protein